MTESTDASKVSNRGAGFPVLSLPEAEKIVRDAGAYGKVHNASALAGYAGHQSATSGPWKQKAAALREWGFITSGSGDAISLTDRAMSLAHQESDEKAHLARLEAFRASRLYMKFYGDLAKNTELQLTGLASKAVNVHRISVASKDKFTKSFVDSAVAVGLAERIGTDRVKILPMSNEAPNHATNLDDDKDEDEGSTEQQATKRKLRSGAPVVDQTWELEHGSISFSITSDEPLAAVTYTKIADVVTAIEALAAKLGSDEGGSPSDGTSD